MPPLGTDFALRFAFKRTKNGVIGNYGVPVDEVADNVTLRELYE